ncbi:hypothetical protein AOLI_G00121430 [Acnodon oligacanthus]
MGSYTYTCQLMAQTGAPAEPQPLNGEKPVSIGRDAHIIKGQQQVRNVLLQTCKEFLDRKGYHISDSFPLPTEKHHCSQNLPGSGPAKCGVEALCQQADMA